MLEQALMCMALNIFHEARGEPILGQYAVAQVTMNRAEQDPRRVCREVARPHQFSWTAPARLRRDAEGRWSVARWAQPARLDPDAWATALAVAKQVLGGRMRYDLTRGADHYHAAYVRPAWTREFHRTVRVGAHIFYRSNK